MAAILSGTVMDKPMQVALSEIIVTQLHPGPMFSLHSRSSIHASREIFFGESATELYITKSICAHYDY
ncbi:MAG: hypothetical protein Q9P14_19060 [candidate division KSB1 bacterium]|nr:hypothetical protein [candidate division KSB1 bacterium]MDQ7065030.1 hypothetical protein [candidate division KSB1 bacterium]